jgi:hypothetical protein
VGDSISMSASSSASWFRDSFRSLVTFDVQQSSTTGDQASDLAGSSSSPQPSTSMLTSARTWFALSTRADEGGPGEDSQSRFSATFHSMRSRMSSPGGPPQPEGAAAGPPGGIGGTKAYLLGLIRPQVCVHAPLLNCLCLFGFHVTICHHYRRCPPMPKPSLLPP